MYIASYLRLYIKKRQSAKMTTFQGGQMMANPLCYPGHMSYVVKKNKVGFRDVGRLTFYLWTS